MYLGALGQQGTTKTIRSQRGERPNCPTGWQVMGRHGSGIRESVECYLPQTFAPPPTTTVTYHAPITSVAVPTAVSTQVSPQISPILAQQQASPGAAVSADPVQSMPGGVTATPSTGITGADLERILAARQAADDAERDAEERQRTIELENLRREMAERDRMTRDIDLARQADDARRVDAERFAREQAEIAARESAGAIPPPPSMTYAPSGGGGFTPPPELFTPPTVDVTQAPIEAGTPWALLLLAAAGIGAVVVIGGKKGKRKARK